MRPAEAELQYVTDCKSSKLQNPEKSGGAESGALLAKTQKISPDLRLIAAVWPKLPEAVRVGILAMVQAFLKN